MKIKTGSSGLSDERLQQLKEQIQKRGFKIPMSENECSRLQGCGEQTLQELIKVGWVVKSQLNELSVRARNTLSNAGIETKEQARQAIAEGRLKPDKNQRMPYYQGDGVRNYGWKTHKEVCKWAGLPEPQKPRLVHVCSHCGKDVPCSPKNKSHCS